MRIHLAVVAILSVAANVKAAELTLRVGEGGLRDDRAPDDSLGGDQLCLDLKANELPLAVSLGHELYTKGPPPTHPYEIESLLMGSVYFVKPLATKWPTDLYLGGGIGLLRIPGGDEAIAIQAVARVNTKVAGNMGVYAEAKYIHSREDRVDFDGAALVIGISFRFARQSVRPAEVPLSAGPKQGMHRPSPRIEADAASPSEGESRPASEEE